MFTCYNLYNFEISNVISEFYKFYQKYMNISIKLLDGYSEVSFSRVPFIKCNITMLSIILKQTLVMHYPRNTLMRILSMKYMVGCRNDGRVQTREHYTKQYILF